MSDDSEEKTEPPTKRKLDDARKKGQIAQSRDIVTVTLTVTISAYLWFSSGLISDRLSGLFVTMGRLSEEPLRAVIGEALREVMLVGIAIVAPAVILIVLVVIVTSIIVNQGILFAVEPLAPKFDKINPAKGLERLFGLKQLIEALKSAIKIFFIGLITWLVLRGYLHDLLLAPTCGPECMFEVTHWTSFMLLVSIALLFLLFAFFDHFLQIWLFRREMRMSKTEVKRQHKDQEGDPLIKSHRRSLARDLVSVLPDDSISETTVVLNDGFSLAVGLRYVPSEGAAPMIINIAVGAGAERFLEQTAERTIPRVERAALTQKLAEQGTIGQAVPPELFSEVAQAIAAVTALSGLGGGE
ncbi:MAG: EscU/YscU/HrcU family type III secretion system export apparatus switch protein [Geminicoccaceae bacterium]|nr:EscU/YscU/HrcU family type III secretion system export apparatus switch protein [Geminicoccaceae bacterium]MCB9942270.1 EscU/YscU/HrcU family type III secretion system export apparatus switch protein [Geminicoccaceae bacterium]